MATSVETMVGIRFRDAGRIYSYDAGDLELELSEYVVAETTRGSELGRVVIAPGQMLEGESERDIQPIIRIATAEDREVSTQRKEESAQTVGLARHIADAEGLRLTIASADMSLDGTGLTVYYESDENVDYRAIVRELRETMNTDVQMEHVGSRDRARLVDGYDRCGLRLCCASWMTSFPAVSIKMAKAQNLSLNPAKISGVCGRLYCCLTFEYEQYRELRGTLPKLNSHVSTPSGDAKVIAVNPLAQSVTLLMESDRSRIEVTGDQMEYGKLVRPIGLTLGEPTPEEDAPRPPATMISRTPQRVQRGGGRPNAPQRRDERPRGPRPEQPEGDRSLRPRRRRNEGGPAPEAGTTPAQPQTGTGPQRPFARQRPESMPPQAQPAPQNGNAEGAGDPARRKRRRKRRRGGGGGGEGGTPTGDAGSVD